MSAIVVRLRESLITDTLKEMGGGCRGNAAASPRDMGVLGITQGFCSVELSVVECSFFLSLI